MNDFLKWFFIFISEILKGFGKIFKGFWEGLKQIFDIREHVQIFKEHSGSFNIAEWILSIISIILVIAVFVLIGAMLVLAVRKYIRFRHSIVSNEDLLEELADLQRQVLKLNKEKDELMAMKVSQLGLAPEMLSANAVAESAENKKKAPAEELVTADGVIQTSDYRFSKLIEVDNFYKHYTAPQYDQ